MTTAPAAPTLASRPIGVTVEEHLNQLCQQQQLTDAQDTKGREEYRKVAKHLVSALASLGKLDPDVKPQGSWLLRTTVRPSGPKGEAEPFDLDAACIIEVNPDIVSSQQVFDAIQSRLRDSQEYATRLTVEKKCLRIHFSDHNFYIDIVPATYDPSDASRKRLLIVDETNWNKGLSPRQTWQITDPFGYATWFEGKCILYYEALTRDLEARIKKAGPAMASSVEPLPPREHVLQKAPLRRVVQLMKSYRDQYFKDEKKKPASILLTTLAADTYQGTLTTEDSLRAALTYIGQQLQAAGNRRIVVKNPSAPYEDLARRLDDATYAKFKQMIVAMTQWFEALGRAVREKQGVAGLRPLYEQAFPAAAVKEAFGQQQRRVEQANAEGKLQVGVGASLAGILAASQAPSARVMASNNFHPA